MAQFDLRFEKEFSWVPRFLSAFNCVCLRLQFILYDCVDEQCPVYCGVEPVARIRRAARHYNVQFRMLTLM